MHPSSLILSLPAWTDSFLAHYSFPIQKQNDRMLMVLALGSENIKRKTGGPFAAAVFETASGNLVAAGVNRVVPCSCSIAHAEMMALGIAQQKYNHYRLCGEGIPALELITSTEPCAMCLGALPWSGIPRVICGATDADARAAGFDEGIKSPDWKSHLVQLGITVETEVCRKEAAELFNDYAKSGLPIYNGRSPE